MSDGIQGQAFDAEPFGHRWSNRPAPCVYDTPPDPIEDHRLTRCGCGMERTTGQSCWSCGCAPRKGER